ncbi:GNAT family N-acetyltransferase [Pseudomonas oryzihabitans]|uniref:RimJ/RimL family protein N-acetyltransferase n=1 Tax=Pseudomonas oryzihabitans TaxID=47885 RepID=A0AAJ2BJ00_9PSED|nr:GNAT family N-acetyltransferase [Pseudomonas psychrotolerans]MDR6235143.1 RimJ/RimL family protein N-acetyltransferase [Pseudomonas psychrotolerans]MDR6355640.1 RimJ/RimL family protein N-acetyltransferase [Pseudomonas psychrotolerans]
MLADSQLQLRQWRPEDGPAFARLNANPEVMRHFPACLDQAASDALLERCRQGIAERGWGFWALERRADGVLLGLLGISPVAPDFPCAPAVEIGWRLDRPFWGQGYATRGARLALAYGFDTLGLEEVVAFTATANQPSVAVMARLSMTDAGTFEHPRLPPSHPLQPLRLFRLSRARWLSSHPAQPAP